MAKMNSQQLFYVGSLSTDGLMQVGSRRRCGRTASCHSCTCVREGPINVQKEWFSAASIRAGWPTPSSTSRNDTLPVFISFGLSLFNSAYRLFSVHYISVAYHNNQRISGMDRDTPQGTSEPMAVSFDGQMLFLSEPAAGAVLPFSRRSAS